MDVGENQCREDRRYGGCAIHCRAGHHGSGQIPLTLAIIPALVVTCDGDRYAIPQVSLLELVRLEADQVANRH